MGLEIQQSMNSLMGSANQALLNEEQNVRKALKVVMGAAKGFATGGVGGAIAGGIGEATEIAGAGNQTQTVQQFLQSDSPQATAMQQADMSTYNAIEAKKAQRAQIDALPTSLGRSVGELPENIRNQIYKEYDKQ